MYEYSYLVVVCGNVLVELVFAVEYHVTHVDYLATRINSCVYLYAYTRVRPHNVVIMLGYDMRKNVNVKSFPSLKAH